MSRITISFKDSELPPVEAEKDKNLSEQLTVQNSPILFGCRTGICATCIVSVSDIETTLEPAGEEELEVLEMIAPGRKDIRLACQIKPNCSMTLKMEDDL